MEHVIKKLTKVVQKRSPNSLKDRTINDNESFDCYVIYLWNMPSLNHSLLYKCTRLYKTTYYIISIKIYLKINEIPVLCENPSRFKTHVTLYSGIIMK